MAEIRYRWANPFHAFQRAQLYAFVDGGRVTNLNGGFGGGELYSTGGGVRADISDRFGANVEVAVPLNGPRYDTGDDAPKVNFRVVHSF